MLNKNEGYNPPGNYKTVSLKQKCLIGSSKCWKWKEHPVTSGLWLLGVWSVVLQLVLLHTGTPSVLKCIGREKYPLSKRLRLESLLVIILLPHIKPTCCPLTTRIHIEVVLRCTIILLLVVGDISVYINYPLVR